MSTRRSFDAFYGIFDHRTIVDILNALRWAPTDHFAADLEWLRQLAADQITDWVVVLPQLAGVDSVRTLFGHQRSVHERSRREGRVLFSGIADPKHRLAADRIAGNEAADDDPSAAQLNAEKRGAVLLYPVFDVTDGGGIPGEVKATELIMALIIAAPTSTGSPDQLLVRFRVIDQTHPSQAIIDIE